MMSEFVLKKMNMQHANVLYFLCQMENVLRVWVDIKKTNSIQHERREAQKQVDNEQKKAHKKKCQYLSTTKSEVRTGEI